MLGGGVHVQQQTIHESGTAHELMHIFGNAIGYWPLLFLVFIGALFVLRKRIKGWISELKIK